MYLRFCFYWNGQDQRYAKVSTHGHCTALHHACPTLPDTYLAIHQVQRAELSSVRRSDDVEPLKQLLAIAPELGNERMVPVEDRRGLFPGELADARELRLSHGRFMALGLRMPLRQATWE